ncbi:MAG: orotidine-5'-phosphate decarboxylase [Methanobacteriota archaeon]|nr:MAG: orotidine-5'-phosphate decarboxylase [Euryarchaeota archaeon]
MDAVDDKQTMVCVGLDPRLNLIPAFLKRESVSKYGETIEAVAACYLAFNKGIIDAVKDKVAIVKPQVAFYEAYGAPGVKTFEETVRYARNAGLIVVEDAKRNDIGSTAEAYSSGHIGEVEFWKGKTRVYDVDAITVSPYLGFDGVQPFLDDCRNHQKGIFILVKTSNPSSGELQDLPHVVDCPSMNDMREDLADDGTAPLFSKKRKFGEAEKVTVAPNYVSLALNVKTWGDDLLGERGYSSVGAVVGATYPNEAMVLRKTMPKAYFLVPGYGAQGGSADDSMACLNSDGYGAIVSSSRDIDYAYRTEPFCRNYSEDSFDRVAAEATSAMIDALSKAMKSADKCPW